ncbi:MAG: cytochrome-c peroxidase, partial [Pseudomonadota bacterium]
MGIQRIKRTVKTLATIVAAFSLSACGGGSSGTTSALDSRVALGAALFNDVNLSFNRTQSCATCHVPEHGFIDNRLDATLRISAVSVGDDGITLGDRNSPSAAYASLAPVFQANGTRARHNPHNANNTYNGALGGQFLDGRADDLAAQAGAPPISAVEMGMPDKAAVVDRLRENPDYIDAFESLFGSVVFDDVDGAYAAMTRAIAAFQETEQLSPFDSRYDRSLRGEYT